MQDSISIDVRQLIRVIFQQWKWILIIAIIMALIGFLVGIMIPLQYLSTSKIGLITPYYQLQLDPEFTTENTEPPVKAYLDIASSDSMAEAVFQAFSEQEPAKASQYSMDDFQKNMNANVGGDPSILLLEVTSTDPATAQDISNLWADLFIRQANIVFGQANPSQVEFLENKLADAQDEYSFAQSELEQFQETNLLELLDIELKSLSSQKSDFLFRQHEMQRLESRIKAEQEILSSQNDEAMAASSDRMVVFNLHLDVTDFISVQNIISPVQWQISIGDLLIPQTVGTLRLQMSAMQQAMEQQLETVNANLSGIDSDILEVQVEIQKYTDQEDLLNLKLDVAHDTLDTVSRKIFEVRMASEMEDVGVKVVSKAVLPLESITPSKFIFTALGLLLGGAIAITGILFLDWWRSAPDK
jgi:uncharacterized protein involved in exopolysaccharide biosynthesis